jgi:hypothetical protein
LILAEAVPEPDRHRSQSPLIEKVPDAGDAHEQLTSDRTPDRIGCPGPRTGMVHPPRVPIPRPLPTGSWSRRDPECYGGAPRRLEEKVADAPHGAAASAGWGPEPGLRGVPRAEVAEPAQAGHADEEVAQNHGQLNPRPRSRYGQMTRALRVTGAPPPNHL